MLWMTNILYGLLIYSVVITGFDTTTREIAITFDACETKTPSFFDKDLLNYIIQNKIPVTLFLSGKFIERNRNEVKEISKYDFIEIENHSLNHPDFVKLKDDEIEKELLQNEVLIKKYTGKKSIFFRFPYGTYNDRALQIVEKQGYKVVHWTFPSGDPDKNLTKKQLVDNVITRLHKGHILIFHINGRGWKTKEAFPEIIDFLKEKGYKLVLLKDVIK